MKKLFTVTVLLAILFFFRAPIIDYSMPFFEQDEDPTDWLGIERAYLDRELPGMDSKTALTVLYNFEQEIEKSLETQAATDDQKVRSYKRQLICELAMVYKRMAIQHLRDGNDELYIEYTRKSQIEMVKCTAAGESSE